MPEIRKDCWEEDIHFYAVIKGEEFKYSKSITYPPVFTKIEEGIELKFQGKTKKILD